MIAILSILLFKYLNSDYMYQDPLLFPSEFHINESTDFSEICFYSIDKTKCPSNINPSNFFGPGEYNSKILSFSKNSVIIHIAESIFTTEPITFSAPAHFYIVGKQIKGKIEVQGNSSIDFQDPTKTEIKLYWSASTKEIPQIKTMLSPKSMFIEIINQNENASSYQIPFYTGKKTPITLSTIFFKNIKYSVKYHNHYYCAKIEQYNFTLDNHMKTLSNFISGSVGDNLRYYITPFLTKLIINGTGAMTDFKDRSSRPWDNYKNTIYSAKIENGATTISDFAFSDCVNIISVKIPDTVTKIGNFAFENCLNLVDVILPDNLDSIGLNLFYNCSSIPFCIIPSKVTQIPDYTFYNCSELFFVEFHEKVTSIGSYSFCNCRNLSILTFSEGITQIPDYSFCNCSSLPSFDLTDNIRSIGSYAFFGCESFRNFSIHEKVTFIGTAAFSDVHNFMSFELDPNNSNYAYESNLIISKSDNSLITYIHDQKTTEIFIPEKVTYIKDYAFYYQKDLKSISIPEGVTHIGSHSFYNCFSITSLVIPDSVTVISDFAFAYCFLLESLTLSQNLESIGDYAFYNCQYLKDLVFPPTLKTIGANAFFYCEIGSIQINSNNQYFTILNQGLYSYPSYDMLYYPPECLNKNYEVHPSCTKICKYAFYHSKFTSITIPDSVTVIDDYAFHYGNLHNIKLPSNLVRIGKYAFYYCIFTELPEKLETIDEGAFYSCDFSSLTKISDSVTFIGENAFYHCEMTQIELPKNLKTMKNKMFRECNQLTEINLNENLEIIEPEAFFQIQYLEAINVPESNRYFKSVSGVLYSYDKKRLIAYPSNKKMYLSTIEETVTTIDCFAFNHFRSSVAYLPSNAVNVNDGAFYSSSITRFEKGNLQHLGKYVFAGCSELQTVNFTGLPSCDEGLFYGCSKLTSVSIQNTKITHIGDWSFAFCSRLERADLPDVIDYIGNHAFYSCKSLVYVSTEAVGAADTIGDFAFYDCYLLSEFYNLYSFYLGDYAFANSGLSGCDVYCNNVGIGAFQNSQVYRIRFMIEDIHICQDMCYECSKLSTFGFFYDVDALPSHMCYNCVSMSSFISPENVSYIGYSAFEGCLKLTTFRIESQLSYIGPRAFANCKMLYNLSYYGATQPKYAIDAFIDTRINLVTVTYLYQDITFCGFNVWTDQKVINENATILVPPSYTYTFIELDEDKIVNNSEYIFDINDYSPPRERELLVLKLNMTNYKITNVIINTENSKQMAISIPDEYSTLNITAINITNSNYINIIVNSSLDLYCHYSVYPRFNDTKGTIRIGCTNESRRLTINNIVPSNAEPLIIVPLTDLYIKTINFDKNNSQLFFDNQFYLSVTVYDVIVQQFVNAQLSSCSISDEIRFGIGSTLYINKSVSLSSCELNIPFNKERKTLTTTYIKGDFKDYPSDIIIKAALENVYILLENSSLPREIFIAESNQIFYCNAWLEALSNTQSDPFAFKYSCAEESIGDRKVYRLYGIESSNSNDSEKKTKKLKPEILAVIITSAIAGVIIIVSICLYCCVFKKKIEVLGQEQSEKEDTEKP